MAPPSPFALQGLDTERRTLRLRWDEPHQKAFAALLPQRAALTEGLCEPTEARITCLSTDGRLPLQALLGEPFGLQLVTDRGELRTFPLLVTQVSLGPCDGSLTVVHLVGRDAMSLMAERRRLRCFEHMTLPQVVDHVLAQWCAQGLGRCFTHAWLGLDFERHAQSGRHGFIQHPDESDSGFVQRLLRTAGIAWFWRPCPADLRAQGLPRQELVLFEAAHALVAAPQGSSGSAMGSTAAPMGA
ncbi:contractile injection system protein, VgrG/Pvc8 family [Azohydromonas lata]|uniref:contractile injection system protein, VgrG/Pvc8 family n=1 Tax=Azohydromonas lata TaxID=45677 RepID=UPI0008353140|nr:contractile injection system protein, VgrG/Pvc8 family [Azohydromonas lata]